jgi:hypothetical protein
VKQKFMSVTVAACQALLMRSLLSAVTGSEPKPVDLFVDNKAE